MKKAITLLLLAMTITACIPAPEAPPIAALTREATKRAIDTGYVTVRRGTLYNRPQITGATFKGAFRRGVAVLPCQGDELECVSVMIHSEVSVCCVIVPGKITLEGWTYMSNIGKAGILLEEVSPTRAVSIYAPTYEIIRGTGLYDGVKADAKQVGFLEKGTVLVPCTGRELACKTVNVEGISITSCCVKVRKTGDIGWVLNTTTVLMAVCRLCH